MSVFKTIVYNYMDSLEPYNMYAFSTASGE